jgi:acetyl-CoA synthetase
VTNDENNHSSVDAELNNKFKFQNNLIEAVVNKFPSGVPSKFNYAFDVIDKIARETPHRLALIHLDEQAKRRDYDYEYFASQSSRFAHALVELGIQHGDRVMLILYRRVEFWPAVLALHKIGAIAIPASYLLTENDIEERAKFGRIKCIIAEHGLTRKVQNVRDKCPELKCLIDVGEEEPIENWESYASLCEDKPDHFERPNPCPGGKDAMLIFFTSGTSGMPKMVEHDYDYPFGHIATAFAWLDLREGDIHLSVSDTGWGKAMWGKFYGQWMAGAVIFVYDFRDKFSPSRLLREMAKNKVTTFCAPPTVYRELAHEDFSKFSLHNLRHSTTAGEKLNPEVAQEWKRQTGLSIYEGYGQTETTLMIATLPGMEVRLGSIGKPIKEWHIIILDHKDKPCPAEAEGEICVDLHGGKPLGLLTGYAKDPERTMEAMRNGYYHTGDRAYMDKDGYVWFLGRMDDVIKSAGYRIGPFEVENALISHEAVLEAAVTGVPDLVRGQVVKATVVLAPGFTPSPALTMELQEHVKNCTAKYKFPRIVEYVKGLPKTLSGKIKRAEIRAMDFKRSVVQGKPIKQP